MNMDTTWKTGVIISISCRKVMIMISMTAERLSSIFCWVAWNCPLLTAVLYIIHTVALAIDPLIQSVYLWVSAHLEICLGIKTADCLGQVYILTYLNSKQSLSEVHTHAHIHRDCLLDFHGIIFFNLVHWNFQGLLRNKQIFFSKMSCAERGVSGK